MLTNCTEDTAKFMGQSLLNHAREIYRYAKAYCEPRIDNEYIDSESRTKFTKHLNRMVKEMYALMQMARYKGVSRFCNREQIDAYIEAANEILTPQDKFDFAALLN